MRYRGALCVSATSPAQHQAGHRPRCRWDRTGGPGTRNAAPWYRCETA